MRLAAALIMTILPHFPYPLVRLTLSEGFRLNAKQNKTEAFAAKWSLLVLLAPRRW